MAKVKQRTQMRPKIENKNVLWSRKIHIAFYFFAFAARKGYVAERNSEMPRAQNKIFEKAARFLSQLFHKFASQTACCDKIRPKVDG